MRYWLIKSEGSSYTIDDLKRDGQTSWTGIRNYQARNYMMKNMKKGDLCLYYHSNAEPTGIYGLAKVTEEAHPDETQYKKGGYYFEPRATDEQPVWFNVDVGFVKKFKKPIALTELKADRKLDGMIATSKWSRLSVQPVSDEHYQHIMDKYAS